MNTWSKELYAFHKELRSQAIEPKDTFGNLLVPGTLGRKPRAKILYLRKPREILCITLQALTEAGFSEAVCQALQNEFRSNDYFSLVKACLDYVDAC